jgi:hypothetical protein
MGGACGRPCRFGGLQRRLDDPGDGGGNLVLQVEHVFQGAVEAVGPEMRADFRVDQLRSDADPAAAFADRAFQHIADAEFPPDPLHIDRLALVGEGAVPGDHEEPADAG